MPEISESVSIPDVEAIKFPSVKQAGLMRLRKFVEANDIDGIEQCISENPLYLLTGHDTPTILQV